MSDTIQILATILFALAVLHTFCIKLFQHLARETVTIRHTPADTALPYRQHGSFLLGNGVGGAGVHWNGHHWRPLPADLRLRSTYEERYGRNFIPEGMTIQDWGVSYEELEPHFDQFEAIGGTVHVRTHEQFADAFHRLLDDRQAAEQLRRQRQDVVARYTRFDGHAADRIARLVADAIDGVGHVATADTADDLPATPPSKVGV